MFRISLRELLVMVALTALAIVSLRSACDAWLTVIMTGSLLAVFIAIIAVAADRGARQAFAVAFALVSVGYFAFVTMWPPQTFAIQVGPPEYDLYQGRLPTTQLLRHVFNAISTKRWIDSSTQQEIPNFDPANPSLPIGNLQPWQSPVFPSTANLVEFPRRENFIRIGHLWFALLFGYLGGRFARFIYVQRTTNAAN